MRIKFVDLTRQYHRYKEELLAAIEEVLEKSDFILGRAVSEFEDSFAKYLGCKYCVGVDSGSSALILSLNVIGVGPGDEVITVPNTFISTAFAISEMGAKVVFVDIDEKTFNIDVNRMEEKITPRTKAINPVHLFGQPADLKPIKEIAEKNNLFVIEDAAQAHLAEYYNKRVGGIGHISSWSFYPGKNLGAWGEAGAVTTDNEDMYLNAKKLRDHGSEKKYYHDLIGHNYRMSEFQAAVLNVKMKYIQTKLNLNGKYFLMCLRVFPALILKMLL